MHKLIAVLVLAALPLSTSAAGCLSLPKAERQACFDRIVASTPEPSPEQKAMTARQGAEQSERYRNLSAEASARTDAAARQVMAEREYAAQAQAQQQAIAAQQRRDAVAEATLEALQRQQAVQQAPVRQAAPPAPRPPMKCNPSNGWCD